MDLKTLVFLFCPPIISKIVAPYRRRETVYKSYSDALRACGDGYDSNIIAKVVVEKNRRVKESVDSGGAVFDMNSLRALVAALGDNENETVNVLDFGGGAGYHYLFFRAALAGSRKVRWCVVETPQMVKAAKCLENDELFFVESIDCARDRLKRVDLVMICGSIQYTPEPLEFLDKLASVGAERLFITRTPLIDSPEPAVLVQRSMLSSNGPGKLPDGIEDAEISYPVTILSKETLESVLEESYKIHLRLNEDPVAHFVGGERVGSYGYLCLKKH